ncbi:MAG: alpha/beta hydrolase-fold protein [Phycisphaerae bacterium]
MKFTRQLTYAFITAALVASSSAAPPTISISFDTAVSDKPYTGRVFVMFMTGQRGDPVDGPSWFGNDPFFSQEVRNWKPGDAIQLDAAKARGYPTPLTDLPAGEYRVQAAIDLNGMSHVVVGAPGNGVSEIITHEHDPATPGAIELKIAKRVPQHILTDSDALKYVTFRSDKLSKFFKRDVPMRAVIALPETYADDKDRKFTTVYTIPGFGGTIKHGASATGLVSMLAHEGLDAVVVYLDPDCFAGHCVFADSANTGPWGGALVEELIPHLEREFRLRPTAAARFVTGHSSGGWSSLWLQVTYPDAFGGTWSSSPDPVDFTAFQTIDIYDEWLNFFDMPDGSPRPIARASGRRKAWPARRFCDMEAVLGRGGQLYSFCAVFGPRGDDGQPVMLWNWSTGKLDPRVAEYWKRYDIRLTLERDWKTLGPKLAGKLHLFCGDRDDFYLDGAFLKLRDTLKTLDSDAYVELIEGAGHGLPPRVYQTMAKQVKAKARE